MYNLISLQKGAFHMTKTYEALPKIVKILLQLVLGWIVGGIYRIVRFTETKNIVTLIVALIVLFTGVGNGIIWIIDLVTEILHDKIWVLAD